MNQRQSFDRIMLTGILLLCAVSVMMVASASMSISAVRYGDSMHIIKHWAIYMPCGLVLMLYLSRIEVDWWRAVALPLVMGAMLLMILVLIPSLGMKINGAQRWFSLFGLTVQPVELLKPVLILYMAYYMAAFPDRLKQFSTGLAPMLVVLVIAVLLLLLQPDFGSAVLLVGVCMGMWFVGGIPLKHLLGMVVSLIPAGALILIAAPYRMKRLVSFLDPWADPLGSGYQLVQSMIAFGAGGVQGAGLGQGVQKLFYLPEPFTDFITAVLGEELGLVGTLGLIAVFGMVLWRGMKLSFSSEEMFPRLLTLGCVLLLATAFIINMGTAMGMMPTKGMPMPLISYGGSALMGSFILLGLLFSVQRHQPMAYGKARI